MFLPIFCAIMYVISVFLVFLAFCKTATCAQWDFFSYGRLHFFGNEKDQPNHWRDLSELARSGKVPQATVINNSEILAIQADASETEKNEALRVCPATRSAQKGPEATFMLYKHLFATSKVAPVNASLLGPDDKVVLVDVHCHAGDHAVASANLMADPGCHLTHVIVQTKNKLSPSSVQFTLKRLACHMASKWMKHELQLCKDGKPEPPPSVSTSDLTNDDRTFLKECKVWDAYEGTQKWQWQVLQLVGTELKIDSTALSTFSTAPPSVRSALQALETKHSENYSKLLEGKLGASDTVLTNANVGSDPGHDPRGDDADPAPVTSLPVIESVDALKSAYTVTGESKCFDSRNCVLMVAEGGHMFLVPKET